MADSQEKIEETKCDDVVANAVIADAVVADDAVAKAESTVAFPSKKIVVTVKTPKERESIEVDENATIKEFKELVATKFHSEPDQLCLIYAGKIMKDGETLATHNIKEGLTIHLVIRTPPPAAAPGPTRPPADISATPFGLGNLGGIAGLGSLGMGSANFMELQNQMQSEILGNPNLLRQTLDNPLVQQIMNDQGTMRTLIRNNPQMQELMQRHPEIGSMLDNPEVLRSTMELARNPSMLQQLMRNHESLVGSLDGSSTTPANPLQNPWITPQQTNRESQPMGILSNPSMASLMQQMAENPQLMQNMISAPYTQQVMQTLVANPEMASRILTENPIMNSNPALQEQVRSLMPQFMESMQNPDVLNVMTNPQALNALMDIQQGIEVLRQAAPNVISNSIPRPVQTESPNAVPDSTTGVQDSFSDFMSRMVGGLAAQHNTNLPPEQRYQTQMAQLTAMGFVNQATNMEALIATNGDVNLAIEKILARGES